MPGDCHREQQIAADDRGKSCYSENYSSVSFLVTSFSRKFLMNQWQRLREETVAQRVLLW